MRLLVTGLSGFTGRHFKVVAAQAGHSVVGLKANLTDAQAVAAEIVNSEFDAVVHLAAISFVGHTDDSAFYAVNVVGTCNLLGALAKLRKPLQKVLIASSANVYGNCTSSPISENQPTAPVNHYAASKLAMEHMARNYADTLPVVFTRPFNYTGPGQALNFVIPKLVDHFARKAPMVELGNMHVEREFNDVRMVCNAYLGLLQHGQPGQVYNVCSGQPYTLQQVIDTLTELSGHMVEAKVNPAFVRANEVHRLCGDPAKLYDLLRSKGFSIESKSLRQTLLFMLNSEPHYKEVAS